MFKPCAWASITVRWRYMHPSAWRWCLTCAQSTISAPVCGSLYIGATCHSGSLYVGATCTPL